MMIRRLWCGLVGHKLPPLPEKNTHQLAQRCARCGASVLLDPIYLRSYYNSPDA